MKDETYKKAWNKMQYFISNGHRVLSSNHIEQLDKLKSGKYAYVTDRTEAEYFISENCQYIIAPEMLGANPWAIGLQLNSVYTQDVTKMQVFKKIFMSICM